MITSERRHFVGFHVTERVRNEIRRMAKKEGISVSRFCYLALLRRLDLEDETEASVDDLLSMVRQ